MRNCAQMLRLFYFQKVLLYYERSEKKCVASKKGTGQRMARSRWWHGPEKRNCANLPIPEEKPVCTRTEACIGCPFPASGFICWSDNGECMRTRIEKLKENSKHDSTEDKTSESKCKTDSPG